MALVAIFLVQLLVTLASALCEGGSDTGEQLVVGNDKPEEFGFEDIELFLVLFLPHQSLLFPYPLGFLPFLAVFSVYALHHFIVYGLQVLRADGLRVSYVLARIIEHTEIVTPH